MTGRSGSYGRRLRAHSAVFISSLLLSACADMFAGMSLPSLPKLDNPFADKEVPLQGKRISVMQKESAGEVAAGRPVALPSQRQNVDWTQPGGTANNAPGHLALGQALKSAWSADAGAGSSFWGKLTSSPIVYANKVFTLDANGQVSAFSLSGGSAVWRTSTTPPNEKDREGFGGGLAADGGRVYAATGFGLVVAIDPESGKKLWEKSVGSPVRASPTAAGERVFVVTMEGQTYCLSGSDGTELWAFRGTEERARILTNSSPAVEGDIAVFPYPTGDVVALQASTGRPIWTESLSRARGGSSLAAMSDTARPSIDGGMVFAVGHAGRMVATSQKSGERLWSLSVPGVQAPWVAGESVFVVDTSGQLLAVTRRDGKIQWSVKLPGSSTWSGPVLAGGRLWLASSTGQLIGVDATSGRVDTTQDLGQPVYIAPIVASGRMFVLTDKAKLIAFN
ncbi:MAG TPA: PQQ-binding-like beta-propeller repeat protein [Hyphomicrobiaceae bacterium]|nr:PQQ-binding-like beta-propeller repeat protein [Hyphomicrobiaceae bacterium]